MGLGRSFGIPSKTTVIKKSISTFLLATTAALIASAIVIVSFVAFGNNGNLETTSTNTDVSSSVVSLSELENDSDVPQVDVTENQLEQSLEMTPNLIPKYLGLTSRLFVTKQT